MLNLRKSFGSVNYFIIFSRIFIGVERSTNKKKNKKNTI